MLNIQWIASYDASMYKSKNENKKEKVWLNVAAFNNNKFTVKGLNPLSHFMSRPLSMIVQVNVQS